MGKILIIEDDQGIRENVVEILHFEGFETLEAQNGTVGLQLAQEHLPDMILCDVRMPECDGYEVLKKLRQNPATAAIPFVFMTAKANAKEDMALVEAAEDVVWLFKPFDVSDLLDITARHIRPGSGG
jgi:CheY-like chemotaxis protein